LILLIVGVHLSDEHVAITCPLQGHMSATKGSADIRPSFTLALLSICDKDQ